MTLYMVRSAGLATVIAMLCFAAPITAHPAPFTYLDIDLQDRTIELSLVAHVFDIAHDIGLQNPDQLLSDATLNERGPAFAALLADRLRLVIDGQPAAIGPWRVIEALPERQGIRLTAEVAQLPSARPGVIELTALLFPYDTVHQTFVNIRERDVVSSQTILDAVNRTSRYYTGTVAGGWAAARTMAWRGFVHIFSGPEHLVLLFGLVVLGATRQHAMRMALAFVAGDLLALALAIFAQIGPPPRFVDPALALAIVYLGTDNLMAGDGRDVRTWIALAGGAIHGFSLADLLRAMSLSPSAQGWSVAALHVGLAGAQLLAVTVLLSLVASLHRRTPQAARRLAMAGSIAVIALGTLWFVQGVFFPASTLPRLAARL